MEVADTWARRARGMLFRRRLPSALLLTPCNSVHGAGMTTSLDVALVDSDRTVVRTLVLRPWRLTRPRRDVVAVLEAPEGSFSSWGLAVGDTVHVSNEEPHDEP
ncbi:DUF192 domain-containing protein [Isoptericola chiayiensis]|uniref:DUF192 domain-containing protein n=1 Tax=Isoptericola chiayiensis TaxID=579446 RepID=UPI0031B5B9A9